VGEDDQTRLVAWDRELRTAHARLRAALRVATRTVDEAGDGLPRELLLYCHGFCTALSGHHAGEDVHLFTALADRHPALRPTIARLEQDHAMIGHLLTELDRALRSREPAAVLHRHLDGLAAIMESHVRYEERELLGVLATFRLDAGTDEVLGPL
jgi:hemerythrin-like domain-containing protein